MIKIDFQALTSKQNELVNKAIAVRKNAYAKYSNFKVGAALLDSKGGVHTGCNVESVDFTLTSHAEMVAIDSMVKSGEREISEIAIAIKTEKRSVPCGLCRQKMLEFKSRSGVKIFCIYLESDNEIREIYETSLDQLMPYAFEEID